MKKVILLVLGMVFLTNCGNNVAVKPENRESFTENPYFKSKEFLSLNEKDHEEILRIIKADEHNTFLEALEKTFFWGNGVWEDVLNDKKSMDYVKKIESVAKSKFYSLSSGGGKCRIFFTAKEGSDVFGKAGKNNMVVVYFNFFVKDVENVVDGRNFTLNGGMQFR